ncbi:MAG: YbaN family protein [Thermoflexaceae bacterium]|nr:YbaN family protein [Thermoflexaceae bacterium]
MKKMINGICVGFGFLSVGLGVLGIVLPLLPTTPFLLLAAALFARGSQKFHDWFTETSIYKRYIEDAVKKKEMTAQAKRNSLLTISFLLLIGFIFSPLWYAKALIAVIWTGHLYYYLFRIKTIKEIKIKVGEIQDEC